MVEGRKMLPGAISSPTVLLRYHPSIFKTKNVMGGGNTRSYILKNADVIDISYLLRQRETTKGSKSALLSSSPPPLYGDDDRKFWQMQPKNPKNALEEYREKMSDRCNYDMKIFGGIYSIFSLRWDAKYQDADENKTT